MVKESDMIENKILSLDEIESNETYKACTFTNNSQAVHVSEVIFESCEFESREFIRSEWLDCTFKSMIFSNMNLSESIFYRCRFEHCQLLGTNFSLNRWKQTTVKDSRCDYLSMSQSIIESCHWQTSSLKEAFFQEVTIQKEVSFDQCELSQADFSETKLANIDFSSSEFDSLYFSPTYLKGAIFAHYQAPQLLSMMGVRIK